MEQPREPKFYPNEEILPIGKTKQIAEEKERNEEIVIYSTGRNTQVFVDGKVFGNGIVEINFNAKAGEHSKLTANCGVLPVLGDSSEAAINGFLNAVDAICHQKTRPSSANGGR